MVGPLRRDRDGGQLFWFDIAARYGTRMNAYATVFHRAA